MNSLANVGFWMRRAILFAALAASIGLSVLAGGQAASTGLPVSLPSWLLPL